MPAWDSPGLVFNAIRQVLLSVSTKEIPEFFRKVVMVFPGGTGESKLDRRLNPSLEENNLCQATIKKSHSFSTCTLLSKVLHKLNF